MRIKEMTISNFRCIKEATMQFDSLTVLVGENGVGKSSFLHAIRHFFSPAGAVEIEDFYNRNNDNKIEIKITFSDLTGSEAEAFKKYTKSGTLTVNKEYKELGKGKYYGYTAQILEFKEIFGSGKSKPEMRNAFNDLSTTSKFAGLERASSYDKMLEIMEKWVEEHPELAEILPIGTEFYGFAGQYQLDSWTKHVFVPAVKEAEEEIDRGSLKALMDAVVLRKISENKMVVQFNDSYQRNAEEIFKIENFPELGQLSSELSRTLALFSPGSDIVIDWGDIRAPELSPPLYDANVIEDGFKGDPSKKGHGLQRALVMTLFKHLQTAQPPESNEESASSEAVGTSSKLDLIFSIEEPELYLHPHRARYLAGVFAELVKVSGGAGRNQIIYSTHSPFFVELERFEQIRLIRKIDAGQANLPRISTCKHCSCDAVIERLRKTSEIPEGVEPAQAFLYRCRPVVNSIVNEGLFSRAVLVVEGFTEKGIFQKLAEMLEKKWDEKGIIVIPSSGKNNLDRLITIFELFGIPTYFVFDADADEKDDEKKKKIADKNLKFQRYLGGLDEPEPFPKSFANDRFAVFQMKIEHELMAILGAESFFAVRDEVAASLGIFNKEKLDNLLKNVECAARFIEEVYRKNWKVPLLEDIVNYATRLGS